MLKGWYQVAFEAELADEITTFVFNGQNFIIVNRGDGALRVFDAYCPHRGAHLGKGGVVEGTSIVCPFHGLKIHMGGCDRYKMSVKEYKTLVVSGLVFVCFDDGPSTGFEEHIKSIAADHFIYPGFKMNVTAPFDLVVENAFDNMHFRTVHKIFNEPDFEIVPAASGAFSVQGSFAIPSSAYQREIPQGEVKMLPYVATAFSPGIVVSNLGGPSAYYVITSSIPAANNLATIRLSIAIRRAADGMPPSEKDCAYLASQSQKGLMGDKAIWESMNWAIEPIMTKRDAAVIGFKEFCKAFTDPQKSEHIQDGRRLILAEEQ